MQAWSGHRALALLGRDRHGDHVPIDHLAEPHARIEARFDDVELLVGDGDVELDAGMGGKKAGEQGP